MTSIGKRIRATSVTAQSLLLLLATRSGTTIAFPPGVSYSATHATVRTFSTALLSSTKRNTEDLYAAVHRKEHEMRQVRKMHAATTDPVRMAMSYASASMTPMRLARALRRVHEDNNDDDGNGNTNHDTRQEKLQDAGLVQVGLRRASFMVDIKRQSPRSSAVYCNFDDAGLVAQAMVRLGADAVFINTDFVAYGGDMTELKSAVQAVRKVSSTAAVVMKDIVVDEIQLGLAAEAGADGIVLMSSVLGASLESYLDLATTIGLETIVECHTRNEVQQAFDLMAPTIMVNNYDRIAQEMHPEQAIKLAGMFPGSGGPIICLATGGISTTDQMKRHLAVGYDGVVIGQAVMGSPRAPEFIRAVRDRTLLPAELAGWGLEDVEFDLDGNVMTGPKRNVPSPDDPDVYM